MGGFFQTVLEKVHEVGHNNESLSAIHKLIWKRTYAYICHLECSPKVSYSNLNPLQLRSLDWSNSI